jgi:predicted hotdog family 3-hydroxylacyl-ACP dehydratase
VKVQPNLARPLGYKQITGLNIMRMLTEGGAIPSDARFALLQAETQSIRWRDDLVDPTASVGMILTAGDPPFLYDGNLGAIEFIEVSASAKLNVTFYGFA